MQLFVPKLKNAEVIPPSVATMLRRNHLAKEEVLAVHPNMSAQQNQHAAMPVKPAGEPSVSMSSKWQQVLSVADEPLQ